MTRILLLASHAIAEYDDLRMFTDLGDEVFCPGGYQDPRVGIEGMRPGVPNAKVHPELIEACERRRAERGDAGDAIDWAKADIPDEVLDWAEVIICHHFLDRWIAPQWNRIKHKRVIWRTCGQSSPGLESLMGHLHRDGLQIVRYSPKERAMPNYAGMDTLIRFGKEPDEWFGWTGEDAVVGNVTQNMVQRGDACGYGFWMAATEGLQTRPAGPGSEVIGGVGALTYDEMRDYLRRLRVYLYTGTQPASYTLGLIEAMMTGVPVVSIGPKAFGGDTWVADVFEGDDIVDEAHDDPASANGSLRLTLEFPEGAARVSDLMRQRAIDLFGMDAVKAQWREFLS